LAKRKLSAVTRFLHVTTKLFFLLMVWIDDRAIDSPYDRQHNKETVEDTFDVTDCHLEAGILPTDGNSVNRSRLRLRSVDADLSAAGQAGRAPILHFALRLGY
jgi:hypothetical protein